MNRITNITKRQIRELFSLGVNVGIYETDIRPYHFSGNLTDCEFLARLYDTKSLPSNDSRFDNADGDIWQHTVNNDDYENDWVFDDDRFPIKNGTDEDYLRFLMEVLSPEVRIDGEVLSKIIEKLSLLLRVDGYELYIGSYISNQPVYTWGLLTEREIASTKFIPFSLRLQEQLKNAKLASIPKTTRRAIFNLIGNCNESFRCTTETGFEYWSDSITEVFNSVKSYYKPKAFNEDNQYTETDDFENFIMSSTPQNVFDTIELFAPLGGLQFQKQVNLILSNSVYKLIDGKMRENRLVIKIQTPAREKKLGELIEEANAFVQSGSTDGIQRGLEKIWDAYERAKSLLHKDKKASISLLLNDISPNDEVMKEKLDKIMNHLTAVGNTYQIRHFENGKRTFSSDDLKLFYFNLCVSFLNLCVGHINDKQ